MFTPSFTPRGEHFLSTVYVEEWRGKMRIFTPGGSKLTLRGEIKTGV
jgi:hypothetical protein